MTDVNLDQIASVNFVMQSNVTTGSNLKSMIVYLTLAMYRRGEQMLLFNNQIVFKEIISMPKVSSVIFNY